MQTDQENLTATTKQRDGLGTNNNNNNEKYDKIKQSILEVYKKINERKRYHHHHYNTPDKSDAAFSYINYCKVKEQYRELLKSLYLQTEGAEEAEEVRAKWHVVILYRLLAYTRDISCGCGERALAYMQLFELARIDAELATHALKAFVTSSSSPSSPLGSWKDVKGLVAYMRRTMNMRDERDMAAYLKLTGYAVSLVNQRLAKDVLAFYKDGGDGGDGDNGGDGGDVKDEDLRVSFVSKWIPRENKSKKYGNFYERLACDYYNNWLPKDSNPNPVSYEKAVVKCKIHYRKLVSFLNQYIDTPQIKMCEQRWSDIAFSTLTRATRFLQDRALLNVKSDDHRTKRHAQNADREACAEKFKVWKHDMMNRAVGISMDLDTHVAIARLHSVCGSAAVNVNAQWAAFVAAALNAKSRTRVIPVLAGSSNKAVGLALATAEHAAAGRTLIIKSVDSNEEFKLHELDASFVKNVKELKRHQEQQREQREQQEQQEQQGKNADRPLLKCLISALKLLMESNVEAKDTVSSNDSPQPFTLTIFADDELSFATVLDGPHIKEDFEEASFLYREFGYAVPSVVLWAMASRHDTLGNDEVSYTSESQGGAFTIRVGCKPSDICAYLGTDVARRDSDRYVQGVGLGPDLRQPEWQTEWNRLVEQLYSTRYYEFEKHFWNNKNIKSKQA